MVIFGAGASFGSRPEAEVSSWRPPLTNQILAGAVEDLGRFPGVRTVLQGLQILLEDDPDLGLEGAMARLMVRAKRGGVTRNHLMAFRFYLDSAMRTVSDNWGRNSATLYDTLLSRLGEWRDETGEPIALVSFNYDLLLERALEEYLTRELPLGDFNAYVHRSDWRLYKLHGSVHWSRWTTAVIDGDPSNPVDVIRNAESLGYDFSNWGLRPYPVAASVGEANGIAIPALALPTTTKQSFECPKEHVELFKRDLADTDRILVIGWRGAEAHVHDCLEKVNPGIQLAVCAPRESDCEETLERIPMVTKRCYVPWVITGGFEWLLKQRTLGHWLRQEPGTRPDDWRRDGRRYTLVAPPTAS